MQTTEIRRIIHRPSSDIADASKLIDRVSADIDIDIVSACDRVTIDYRQIGISIPIVPHEID